MTGRTTKCHCSGRAPQFGTEEFAQRFAALQDRWNAVKKLRRVVGWAWYAKKHLLCPELEWQEWGPPAYQPVFADWQERPSPMQH